MITFFHWHHAYYVPWAKGALNRHVPGCNLTDNANTEEAGYRSAIRWWREKNALGSSVIFDEATQNSLIKADAAKPGYVGWVQTALTLTGYWVFPSGAMDPNTKQAVKKFQKERMGSNNPDGVVGPKTETALMLWSHTRAPGRVRDVPKYNNYIDPWKPPPPPDDPEPAYKRQSPTWYGLAVRGGGASGSSPVTTGGGEDLHACLWNWKTAGTFYAHIHSERAGLTVGASFGLALVLITGIYEPSTLNNVVLDELDFNIAIGIKPGVVKAASALRKLSSLSGALSAIRAMKAGSALKPAAEAAETVKKALEASSFDAGANDVSCTVVDISAGAEVAFFKKTTKFKVLRTDLE